MGPISPSRLTAVACALSTCCVVAAARASTVVNMNAERLSHYAGQVVRADITAVESYFAENPKRIETRLTLSRVEYWKGGYDGAPDSFDLIAPGGRVGDMHMRICCAPEFKAGQQWVLFLLPQYKTFPTVGLGQGGFLIKADETSATYVYQEGFAGITGITDAGEFQYAFYEKRPAHPHAALDGLTVRAAQSNFDRKLLTLAEFKTALQPILEHSHDYQMTQPAGECVPVVYQPTNFKQTKGAAITGTTRGDGQPNAAAQPRGQNRTRTTKPANDEAATTKSKRKSQRANESVKGGRDAKGGE